MGRWVGGREALANEWTNQWLYGWMDGQTDGWRDGCILAFLEFSILLLASPPLASEHLHPHEQATWPSPKQGRQI